ncbi:MAG TPA: DNA-processing protein DprA [Planctomycetota bacterium]|nr:DNA-processing protein DprA [Planctomycetota bacterium]
MRPPLLHLSPTSNLWPAALAELDPAPEDLWLVGRRELLGRTPAVAIVGSRSPTPYGEAQARRFACALAEAGALVVSGLARGIDSVAHLAALESGAGTIAVLACGVDRPWPRSELSERIAREGLLISEYEPGTPPRRHHFPLRNRIISGLSTAVLVVEAAWASGSLITARWAADQGRSVFAIPGRVDHPMARGAHRLIREGASLVESPEELLGELFASGAASGAREQIRKDGKRTTPVLDALRGETLTADDLARLLGQPVSPVLTELVEWELIGRVLRHPGGLYSLAEG